MIKSKWLIPVIIIGVVAIIGFSFLGYVNKNYNKAVQLQEEVNAKWGNVQSAYQRRADLIPNLVNTVKGAAENEKEILTKVTQARAGIVNAETPSEMEMFGKEINTAINMAFEAYPQIRSTDNFATLQAQLEGSENRINTERNRYNEVVKIYNSHIRGVFRRMAINIFADDGEFEIKESFQATEEAQTVPDVEF